MFLNGISGPSFSLSTSNAFVLKTSSRACNLRGAPWPKSSCYLDEYKDGHVSCEFILRTSLTCGKIVEVIKFWSVATLIKSYH